MIGAVGVPSAMQHQFAPCERTRPFAAECVAHHALDEIVHGVLAAEQAVDDIRARAPHVLFVGMPTPFKDVFCQRHRDRLQVPVIIGVGGSFDVLAGVIARAPVAAQSMGLEWAWRLVMEPRKLWKRYLTTNTEFVWLVMRELVRRRA